MAKSKNRALANGIAAGLSVAGLACIGIALFALVGEEERTPRPASEVSVGSASRSQATVLQAADAVEDDGAADVPTAVEATVLERDAERDSSYYPLEVGRYWVYRYEDPETGVITEVERRIERREIRPDVELFYFSDGTMAYRRDGKVFEMGPAGGVNVVPVALGQEPFVYRSQGLHIEKSVGAVDTALVWGGRRFDSCLSVVTRFRRIDQSEDQFGIGLVGREQLSPNGASTGDSMRSPSVLQSYGVNSL
jgi:hypothetical protein